MPERDATAAEQESDLLDPRNQPAFGFAAGRYMAQRVVLGAVGGRDGLRRAALMLVPAFARTDHKAATAAAKNCRHGQNRHSGVIVVRLGVAVGLAVAVLVIGVEQH
jgi:hypothetical protein